MSASSNTVCTWAVGELAVHRIDEIALPPSTGGWLLPGATPEVVAGHGWLRPEFADEHGVLNIDSHSFAFVIGGKRVIVDTGIGNGKQRANPAWHDLDTDFLNRLTRAGFPPETVDLVIITHLHADHVGWNTHNLDGEWVPTFANARYLTSRAERQFWAGYDMDDARAPMFHDSVYPVEQAGLLDLLDVPAQGLELLPGLCLFPTPGHTPGQVAVELTSHGDRAVITGDCIHHPVQLAEPAIGAWVDIDPQLAETSRRAFLAEVADTDTLVLGTHFAPPTAGHVSTVDGAYRLVPAPPVTRS